MEKLIKGKEKRKLHTENNANLHISTWTQSLNAKVKRIDSKILVNKVLFFLLLKEEQKAVNFSLVLEIYNFLSRAILFLKKLTLSHVVSPPHSKTAKHKMKQEKKWPN